jgi:hypothetical protein
MPLRSVKMNGFMRGSSDWCDAEMHTAFEQVFH